MSEDGKPPPLPPKRKPQAGASPAPDELEIAAPPRLSPRRDTREQAEVAEVSLDDKKDAAVAFLQELRRAREWDELQFANEVASSFKGLEFTAQHEKVLSAYVDGKSERICLEEGASILGDDKVKQVLKSACERVSVFDAVELAPALLSFTVRRGWPVAQLASFMLMLHADNQLEGERLFFGARKENSVDVCTLVLEHYLRLSCDAFLQSCVLRVCKSWNFSSSSSTTSASSLLAAVLDRVFDANDVPQTFLHLTRQLNAHFGTSKHAGKEGVALAGLFFGTLLANSFAWTSTAMAPSSEAAKKLLGATKQVAIQFAGDVAMATPMGLAVVPRKTDGKRIMKIVEEKLNKAEEKLRTSAGKIETKLQSSRGPRGSGQSASANSSPLMSAARSSQPTVIPQKEPLPPVDLAEFCKAANVSLEAVEEVVQTLEELKKKTQREIMELKLSPRTEGGIMEGLLKWCEDCELLKEAMRGIEGEGCNYGEMKILPPLPPRPPPPDNPLLYKNYMRLRFEYQTRLQEAKPAARVKKSKPLPQVPSAADQSLDDDAEKLVEALFSDDECE